MNARELHDDIAVYGSASWNEEDKATLLRALDLLARVEESEDELVRELRDDAKVHRFHGREFHAETCDAGAAALVALRAERDRLKAHAEAMASAWENYEWDDADSVDDMEEAVFNHRRDFPKETP